jgi:hypothetical protein
MHELRSEVADPDARVGRRRLAQAEAGHELKNRRTANPRLLLLSQNDH